MQAYRTSHASPSFGFLRIIFDLKMACTHEH